MTTGLVIICRNEPTRGKRPSTAFILDKRDSSGFFASKLAPAQNSTQKKRQPSGLAFSLTARSLKLAAALKASCDQSPDAARNLPVHHGACPMARQPPV